MAAMKSAEAGSDALLIEKRKEIGTPVRCAEGMTKEMFQKVGIEPCDAWIDNKVHGAKIVSPSNHILKVDSSLVKEKCGYILNREIFDRDLAIMAHEAGAKVVAGTALMDASWDEGKWRCTVSHMGRRFDIFADVIIAADGFESQVGRWCGINTTLDTGDMISSLEYTLEGIEGDHRFIEFHFNKDVMPGGYAWVFWKGPGKANVGLGINARYLKDRAQVKDALERFIESKANLKMGEVTRVISGGIPVSRPLEKTVSRNLLLVGDAARVTDPMTGGGIVNAIITGRMAGSVAGEFINNGRDQSILDGYEKMWRGAIENELLQHYIVKNFLEKVENEHVDKVVKALRGETLTALEPKSLISKVVNRYPELEEELSKVV